MASNLMKVLTSRCTCVAFSLDMMTDDTVTRRRGGAHDQRYDGTQVLTTSPTAQRRYDGWDVQPQSTARVPLL